MKQRHVLPHLQNGGEEELKSDENVKYSNSRLSERTLGGFCRGRTLMY